jgi:hypothetical protein
LEKIVSAQFQTWFDKEVEKGLVDIKFAITPGRGACVEAIQSEVLTCELAIAGKLTKPAPQATSMVPDHITAFVQTVK